MHTLCKHVLLLSATQALMQGESHAATFRSILLFLGPHKMSEAASCFNLSYSNTKEMVTKWQTAVLLSETAVPLDADSKSLSFRLRDAFRNVKGDWLRDMYVLINHARSEAEALNIHQLVRAKVSYIAEGSPFPHQELGQGPQASEFSSGDRPSIKRIRVTIGGRTLVPPRSPEWLLNLCKDPLLTVLDQNTLKELMATNRQLRAIVHSFVTTLKFGVNCFQASQRDLHMLGKGEWPNLQVLVLQHTVDAASMSHLTQCQLTQLTSLKLRLTGCQFTAAQLAKGDWPSLQNLNLSNSCLTMSAMAALKNGMWPKLRQLILHNCRLESQAIVLLTDANWDQLELLDLRGNDLDGRDVASLSLGMWPSLQTLHAGNIMEPSAWTQLRAGQWPQLQKLTLTAKWPSIPATTGFPWVDVYSVGPDSGLPALKHCQVYQNQLCPSLAASIVSTWPRLCSLDLTGCNISDAALQPFEQACWPCLTELNLSCTDVDAAGIGHVVSAKMPGLQRLRLEKCRGMDPEAFGQLSTSRWPHLEVLALSYTLLGPECMELANSAAVVSLASKDCLTSLTQAKWPKLKRLELAACRVSEEALQVLVKGDWPELQHLDLSCSGLRELDLEPLRGQSRHTIRLAANELQPTRLLPIGMFKWPKLYWLNLSLISSDGEYQYVQE